MNHYTRLQAECRDCQKSRNKTYRENGSSIVEIDKRSLRPFRTNTETHKYCAKCGEFRERSQFNHHAENGDGLQGQCRSCNHDYYENNRDVIREYHNSYYQGHKSELLEYARNRYQDSPEVRARHKNRIYLRRSVYKETDITPEWLANLLQTSTHCLLCSVEFTYDYCYAPTYPNLDHIRPLCIGGKHMMDNVRYICGGCNNTRPVDGSDL